MAEQRNGVQSLRVDGPDPEIFGLQTPESIVDRSVRVRRKLPTPPLIDPSGVEEHIRRTMDKLRTQKAFRRHLGGAQNNDSDSSISTVGLQNLCSITAPVISGRRRMAANFPVSERQTTGSAVLNDAVQRGASNGSDIPLRSHISIQAVSNVMNSSVRKDNFFNAPVFDTATTQSVAPIQSTPLYVSSNPCSYAYVNIA